MGIMKVLMMLVLAGALIGLQGCATTGTTSAHEDDNHDGVKRFLNYVGSSGSPAGPGAGVGW
jgi:hypothetical protein